MSEKGRRSSSDSKNKSVKAKKTNQSKKPNIEYTTRIRIDKERLEDSDSLDTSFLEGRIEKKFRTNKKAKENLLHPSNSYFSFSFLKHIIIICN